MPKFYFREWKKSIVSLTLFLALTACNLAFEPHDKTPEQIGIVITPSSSLVVQESEVVFYTLKELVDMSDVIVIGRAVKIEGIVNTIRVAGNPIQQHPDYFGIGYVHQVEVESYLKGQGPNLIYVIQNVGFLARSQSQEITDEAIELAKLASNVVQLTLDKRYILFLGAARFSYENFSKENLFSGRAHPWRFEFTKADCVQLEDEFTGLVRYFPPRPFEEFVKLIHDPNLSAEIAYPPPDGSVLCMPESGGEAYP
jgi:hypothetical protein